MYIYALVYIRGCVKHEIYLYTYIPLYIFIGVYVCCNLISGTSGIITAILIIYDAGDDNNLPRICMLLNK